MSKEAIEALESARAHILDAYRIWQADDVSAVPPPKSGAGAVIAKIDAVLSSPIAVEGPEGWQLVPVKPTEAMIEEANECEASWKSIWPAMLAAAPVPPSSTECAARRQGTTGGNDAADCNWPFCGCDPHADKVIAAIEESGMSALISSRGQEVEAKRWLVEETLPSGSVRWSVFEHEHQAKLEAAKATATITPLFTHPQTASTALVERLERERDYAVRWANKAVEDVKEHDRDRIAELETVLRSVEDVIFGSTLRVGSPEYFGVRKLIRDALSASHSTSREGER